MGDTAVWNHGEQAGWEDSVPRFLCLPALYLHSRGLPRAHSKQKSKGAEVLKGQPAGGGGGRRRLSGRTRTEPRRRDGTVLGPSFAWGLLFPVLRHPAFSHAHTPVLPPVAFLTPGTLLACHGRFSVYGARGKK